MRVKCFKSVFAVFSVNFSMNSFFFFFMFKKRPLDIETVLKVHGCPVSFYSGGVPNLILIQCRVHVSRDRQLIVIVFCP